MNQMDHLHMNPDQENTTTGVGQIKHGDDEYRTEHRKCTHKQIIYVILFVICCIADLLLWSTPFSIVTIVLGTYCLVCLLIYSGIKQRLKIIYRRD